MTDSHPSPPRELRVEHDTMGQISVPASALWGAQTQRALDNIPLGDAPLPLPLVHALGLVKACAARANVDAGVISQGLGEAISLAADEVAAGHHDDQFPVSIFQTGSGTSSNMNANEVIAALATARLGQPVHPNDHVNASQSSNDVFPTATHVAVAVELQSQLLPGLQHLQQTLAAKAEEFAEVVKPGRTHLMDAAPVTLGAEYRGYARQVELARERVAAAVPDLLELPLGGTAVGTGLNAPHGYAQHAVRLIAAATELEFRPAADPMEAQSARDALVATSGQLKALALALWKICSDLRWSGSGPHAGLGEVTLPPLQPGSSIMPGKVNPVVPEAVMQVCARVVGNDAAVTMGATTSAFELNTAMPLIAASTLDSVSLLSQSCRLLADRVVQGVSAHAVRLRELAERSPALATALNTLVGYERATEIVKSAESSGRSIRGVAQSLVHDGTLTQAQLDEVLDLDRLANGE